MCWKVNLNVYLFIYLFFKDVKDEFRQNYRNRILDANKEVIILYFLLLIFLIQSLIRVCKEHLLSKINKGEVSSVIFGNELNELEPLKKKGFIIEEPIPGLNLRND